MSSLSYRELIDQSYDFPTNIFGLNDSGLCFHNIDLMKLIDTYGSPLKITYLPKIATQIEQTNKYFADAFAKYAYGGSYTYTYCTKSSHFRFVMEKVLDSGSQLEISSAYDTALIRSLYSQGVITKDLVIICNGFKSDQYLSSILRLREEGFKNITIVFDNIQELTRLQALSFSGVLNIGLRVATEEEPMNELYTSRLGISSKQILKFYKQHIEPDERFTVTMLHFFINTKIKDTTYYRSELSRLVDVYCDLSEICPTLSKLDIGGGFPIQTSLDFQYDYAYMADQIVWTIKHICDANACVVPDIITEFGTYTVGESGAILYKIIGIKEQNEKEKRYMINSSFITTLPDTWGIGQKYILLPINQRDREYQNINLGGITCDGDDFYNKDYKDNQIILPKIAKDEHLYIGCFHTGAYQESIGGYGGIQHCLIPAPRHILIDKKADGELTQSEFAPEQDAEQMLRILGYA